MKSFGEQIKQLLTQVYVHADIARNVIHKCIASYISVIHLTSSNSKMYNTPSYNNIPS